MKKVVMILMLAAVAACKKDDVAEPQVLLGTKIEAAYEKDVLFQEGVNVKITKIEDSRCPKNVVCVWAGMIKLFITISENNVSKDAVVEALVDGSKPAKTTVELNGKTYEIEVLEVLPYPQTSQEISLKDYKVSLTVKKQ